MSTIYGPFSPFQQLVHIHFPGSTGKQVYFLYYNIVYTLTWAVDNPPAQQAVAQLISIDNPDIVSNRAFSYGVGGGSTTLLLDKVTGDVALALYDAQPNYGGLITAMNAGTGENVVFWGDFSAVGYFSDGSTVSIQSPISPTIGTPTPATGPDGIGGNLNHKYRSSGNPVSELGFLYPNDQFYGVLISANSDFRAKSKINPIGPSGNTGVSLFFSTDMLLGWPLNDAIA